MNIKKTTLWKTILCVPALALALTGAAAAQNSTNYVTDSNTTGTAPYRSYAGARENIDLKNLNLNVVIPLFSLPGRNGLDVEVAVSYNSIIREWVEKQAQGAPYYVYDFIPAGGASDFPELAIAPTIQHLGAWYQLNGQSWHPNRYLVRDRDGTRHDLRDKDYDTDVNSTVYNTLERMRADDGTYLEYREADNLTSGTLYLKNGTQIAFASGAASSIRDTNGNRITYSGNVLTDTMGRTVTRTGGGNVTGVTVADAAGQNLVWTLNNTPGAFPYTTTLTLATDNGSNQQKFLFEWNQFGPLTSPDGLPTGIMETKLTKVTYPTGGWTRYEWGLNYYLTNVALKRKCVSAGAGQPESCWSYTEIPWDVRVQTRPDGSWIRHTFLPLSGFESKTEYYSAASVLMKTVDREWISQRGARLPWRETITLHPQNLKAKVEYDYDADGYVWNSVAWSNGNVVAQRDYDWGSGVPGALLRTTQRTWWTGAATGTNGLRILDRLLNETIRDGAGVQVATATYTYDNYASPRTLISVTGAVQRDAAFGTSYTTRGNVSKISRWISGTTYADTWMRYDICGNVQETTDPRGYTSYIRYNQAYQFALPYETEDPKAFKDTFVYDFSDAFKRGFGMLTRRTDPNGRSTDFVYDRWGRLKTATFPDGGREDRYYADTDLTVQRSGVFVFNERANPPYPRVKTYTLVDAGLELVATAVFDGLGRSLMTGSSNGIAGKTDWTRSEYDANGRSWRNSNPRTLTLSASLDSPAASSFTKWTTNVYDGLDRVIETTTPDHTASVPQKITTTYAGNETTVADQAGFQRKTKADGAGRIVQAFEPDPALNNFGAGSYSTTYLWTPLDKLKQVTQGSQTRSFLYDGLGRMTSETHPEWGTAAASSGTSSYVYDGNSNLTQKTDPRGVVSTWAYDQLNRPTSVTYSDGTPATTFSYDLATAPNGKRRRTGMADGSGSRSYEYDVMGRTAKVVWSNAAFTGGQQTGQFVYNYAGGIKESRWPGIYDGPTPLTIYWTYDAAGRQKTAWWSNNGGGAYQSLATGYTFDYVATSGTTWAVETTNLANGTVETVTYNDRLQPRQRRLTNPTVVWNLDYNFANASSKNNGNVWGIDETTSGFSSNRDFNFGYDWLNRIKTADSPGQWGLSFGFDRYGNRLSQTATVGAPPVSSLAYSTRNRITTAGSNSYDNSGNLLGTAGQTYQYDAENRIKTVNSGSSGTYTYDGDGRRAKRVGNGETRFYFYDPDGNPIWEFKQGVGWESFNLYFNTKHLAVNNVPEGLRWRHQDHLGNLRVKTNSAGAVLCMYWYYPYGELWNSTCSEADARRFTDKERDPESGLDYFGVRYYAPAMGRFTGTDVASADLTNPQSFNKYRYGLNNPLRYVDPNGLYEIDFHLYLTFALARAAGFSEGESIRIASANQRVDIDLDTHPIWGGYSARRAHHFTSESTRVNLLARAVFHESLQKLGVYLHAAQDSFSHEGFGALYGQLFAGTGPDKTYNDPDKAVLAAQDTYDTLVSFRVAINPNQTVTATLPFREIAGAVAAFARAETKTQKEYYLRQILQKVAEAEEKKRQEEAKKKKTKG